MKDNLIGSLLTVENGLRIVCPHCQYNGATEPKASVYPFVLCEDMRSYRPIDTDDGEMFLRESDFGEDYSLSAINPTFACGDCDAEFRLSDEDFNTFTRTTEY